MRVAILTVGDELLAGETENTNATWLAGQVTDRGGVVRRILTVPDDPPTLVDRIRAYHDRFDAVLVTGGLGGTHDDLTVPAVADALDREVVVHEAARAAVERTAAALAEAEPELFEQYDLDFDPDAWASLPAGARHVENPVGLAPGAVVDGVYLLPGVPEEMRGVFGNVAEEFGGDRVSRSVRSPAPEGALAETLAAAGDRFDVAVGSYPSRADREVRVRVSGTDPDAVDAAVDWLAERIDTV
ncbi:competence/damage-inducible protein A [Halobaculum sp. MBLA0143]|uniref:competence/damage-inducible protein A n=1 Tax=Halobaculum sp. MBLA0143 TaxID=3079933 RepID=UPI0035249204